MKDERRLITSKTEAPIEQLVRDIDEYSNREEQASASGEEDGSRAKGARRGQLLRDGAEDAHLG